jgi:hypothetical protein
LAPATHRKESKINPFATARSDACALLTCANLRNQLSTINLFVSLVLTAWAIQYRSWIGSLWH